MAQDNIETIKAKIDVVDLIQEYIKLKPAGTNNYKANCPFHQEKTPSFMVSKDKQIWHCFGCGEGGDIFAFVQKMEGLEFPEALRVLAKKAGVQLQYQDPAISNQKTKLLDICRAAAELYHKLLLDHPKAQFVRDYLQQRQVKEETVEEWQLGFAPDAWETLNTYLAQQKKFSEADIFQAGLTLKKDRGVGYLDRFRNRLMFPIWNAHGDVVGFGGRWLGEEKENAAKYINSPQTIIYNKSAILYGMDKAKTAIKQAKQAIVVEGYMDCIASHQAGAQNVVASSGTALTPDQVKLIKRFTDNIAFAFDQDLAGNTAAKRGIEVAWQQDMHTTVIHIPEGKDPDDLIKKDPQAWQQAISEAQSVMEYYFESTLREADLSDVQQKKEIAKTLLPVIIKLADSIEQTHYIQKLATLLRVDEVVLRDKLKHISSTKRNSTQQSAEKSDMQKPASQAESLEERIIGIALAFPGQTGLIADMLKPEYLTDATLLTLYKQIIVYYNNKHTFDYNDFVSSLPQSEAQQLKTYADILSLKAEEDFRDCTEQARNDEVLTSFRVLKRKYIRERLQHIEQQMQQAEAAGNQAEIDAASQEFTRLANELNQLEQ